MGGQRSKAEAAEQCRAAPGEDRAGRRQRAASDAAERCDDVQGVGEQAKLQCAGS